MRSVTYVLLGLASYGVWKLWTPVYFLLLFPPTVTGTAVRHFVFALAASVAAAVLWSGTVGHIVLTSFAGARARAQALLAMGLAFAVFMIPTLRFLWRLYVEWAFRLTG